MWDKIKAFFAWVWNWITVIVALVMGVLTQAVAYLDQLAGIDWTQVISTQKAALITFGVALIKAIVAAYNAQKAQP